MTGKELSLKDKVYSLTREGVIYQHYINSIDSDDDRVMVTVGRQRSYLTTQGYGMYADKGIAEFEAKKIITEIAKKKKVIIQEAEKWIQEHSGQIIGKI